MKTILVPTDFSAAALNAAIYAADMAKVTNSKLVLFHVCHIPVVTPNGAELIIPLEVIEKSALKDLEEVKLQIRKIHGNELVIECTSKVGLATDEINRYTL